MTIKELREEAKNLGIIGVFGLSKKELEDRIALEKQNVVQMSIMDFKASLLTNFEVIDYEDEETWHLLRQKRIGGSDVGAILGVNPYKSIIDVYIDKTEGSTFKGNEATHWGHMLESVVMKEFASKHNELEVYEAPYSIVGEYVIANVDGVVRSKETGEYGILEIKTTNAFNSKAWEEDEIPQSYYAQVQHYLSMTGYTYAYIAVLIGGQKYKEFYIERSEEDIALIEEKTNAFYFDNIVLGVPPMPDGSDAYMEYLKKKALELESNEVVELDELEEKAKKINELVARQKDLEKQENLLKEEILTEMLAQGTRKATAGSFKFNIQSRKATDMKEFEKAHPDLVKSYKELEKNYKKEASRFLSIR